MDAANVLPFLPKPFPSTDHSPAGHDDEFPPPSIHALHNGAQAMGYPFCRLRARERSHIHLDVPLAADELLAFTTTDGAYHELLSNLGWDCLYG